MTEEQLTTRRTLLTGLGVGTVAATAGCLTTLPSFGQRVRYGDVDEPAADGATYRRWLPDTEGARAYFHVPGERGEETLGGPVNDSDITNRMPYVGVERSEVEYICRVFPNESDGVFVLRTDPDREHVQQVLANRDYERVDAYRGVDRYEYDESASVGIGDDVVLYTSDTVEQFEPVIDARTDESFSTRTQRERIAGWFETIGAHPVTEVNYWEVGEVEELPHVGVAEQYAFEEDAAYYIQSRVYPDGEDISQRELESEIESVPNARDATRVDLRIDEPYVTVVVELTHDRFVKHFGPLFDYPLVNWESTYDADAGEVEFVHDSGEAVDSTRVEIRGSGFSDELPQFADEYRTISPGDNVVVDITGYDDWTVGLDIVDPVTDKKTTLFSRFEPEQ